jgi:hypothetical protein
MRSYAVAVTPPGDVVLEDSYVLDLGSDSDGVWLLVEAALGRDHPRFYWPPHAGEQHAYARAKLRLRGVAVWTDGPHPPRLSDASGELDYGDPTGWVVTGSDHQLDGEWGSVTVAGATVEVDWESIE